MSPWSWRSALQQSGANFFKQSLFLPPTCLGSEGAAHHEVAGCKALSLSGRPPHEREPRRQFWHGLKEIAAGHHLQLNELIHEIRTKRQSGNLSSALGRSCWSTIAARSEPIESWGTASPARSKTARTAVRALYLIN